MAKLISVIFIYISTFLTSVLILMFGWGLEPVSWLYIILGFFAHTFLITLIQVLAESD